MTYMLHKSNNSPLVIYIFPIIGRSQNMQFFLMARYLSFSKSQLSVPALQDPTLLFINISLAWAYRMSHTK